MTDIGNSTWTEIHDQSFTGPVDVDGKHFINCKVTDGQLRYGGGQLPRFENCEFDSISWYFHGAALRTIQLLQFQNQGGESQQMLDELFRPGNVINA